MSSFHSKVNRILTTKTKLSFFKKKFEDQNIYFLNLKNKNRTRCKVYRSKI